MNIDWGRENGKVRLPEDVEVRVYFSLVTSLSDSCCLWVQNSCWVLKLYSRKVAGPDSSWVGRPWGGFLFTRCLHTPVPSAWPPGRMDCWEDSPGQEPVGSGLRGAHTWPSLQGAKSLRKLMSIELVMSSNHLIHRCSLLIQKGVFQQVSSSHQMDKVLEHQLQHQPFQ